MIFTFSSVVGTYFRKTAQWWPRDYKKEKLENQELGKGSKYAKACIFKKCWKGSRVPNQTWGIVEYEWLTGYQTCESNILPSYVWSIPDNLLYRKYSGIVRAPVHTTQKPIRFTRKISAAQLRPITPYHSYVLTYSIPDMVRFLRGPRTSIV